MALLDHIGSFFEGLGERDQAYIDLHNPSFGTGYRRMACLVGLIVIGLPVGTWLVSAFSDECFYNSVSHYFYGRWVGAPFVAALAFLGAFLIGYSGENALEGRVALIAGLLLIFVAVVPTGGIGCEDPIQVRQLFAQVSFVETEVSIAPPEPSQALSHFQLAWGKFGNILVYLHFIAAAVVLLLMALVSFFVFTRVEPGKHVNAKTDLLLRQKAIRNLIYTGSGFMILCCISTLFWGNIPAANSDNAMQWNVLNLTFWFEAVALFAFGFSWLLRGRFFGRWLVDQQEIDNSDLAGSS